MSPTVTKPPDPGQSPTELLQRALARFEHMLARRLSQLDEDWRRVEDELRETMVNYGETVGGFFKDQSSHWQALYAHLRQAGVCLRVTDPSACDPALPEGFSWKELDARPSTQQGPSLRDCLFDGLPVFAMTTPANHYGEPIVKGSFRHLFDYLDKLSYSQPDAYYAVRHKFLSAFFEAQQAMSLVRDPRMFKQLTPSSKRCGER